MLEVLTRAKELQDFCARASFLVAQVGVRMATRPHWKIVLGQTSYERLRGGETELKVFGVNAGHLLMRARREQIEVRQRHHSYSQIEDTYVIDI